VQRLVDQFRYVTGEIIDRSFHFSYVRFGWFVSSAAVSTRWNATQTIVDHWRALSMPNVTSLFVARDDLKPLVRLKSDERRTYCDQFSGGETDAEAGEKCRDGIYREAPCRHHHSKCATLLSSYPGWSDEKVHRVRTDVAGLSFDCASDICAQRCCIRASTLSIFQWSD
jgi:hypothetical protein